MLLDSIGMNTLNWHCCNHEMTTVSTVHWNLVKTRVCQDSNQRKQMRDPLVNQWVFSPCHVCIRIHWSFFVATTHAVSGSKYCKSSNSWQLWLHGEKTAPAPGLIGYPPPAAEPYTNEYEVFLEVRFYENRCLLPVGKQALVANKHYNHISNYILCVCVLLPFAKIRCEVAFVNYCTSSR